MRRATAPVLLASVVALAAVSAPSDAQAPVAVTTLDVRPTVSPSVAGTPARPRSVRLGVRASLTTRGPDGEDKPILQRVVVDFPKGSLYLGGRHPRCTQAQLERDLPKVVCPKAIVGTGTGEAWADTVPTRPRFTLVNGGATKVYLYTQLTNPAVVDAPVPGTIRRGGVYGGYRATFVVPEILQVVAGTPISLHRATGRTTARNWIATTSCPRDRRWPFRVVTSQDTTADATFVSSVRCSSPR